MRSDIYKGSFLVAGTAIGAGMLVLPLSCSFSGFIPGMIVNLITCIITMITGLLFANICSSMKSNVNMITIVDKYLGKFWKNLTWVIYLLIFFSIIVGYISFGGDLIGSLGLFSKNLSTFIFISIFGLTVIAGPSFLGKVNSFLFVLMIIAFFIFIFSGFENMNYNNFLKMNFKKGYLSIPAFFASFGFHSIIPTLNNYLDYDYKKVRKAIVIGCFIPFLVYLLWSMLMFGTVPYEALKSSYLSGDVISSFSKSINSSYISIVIKFFSFFAITTSFLGVAIGLVDFLIDGFKLKKTFLSNIYISLAVFIPATLFAIFNTNIFTTIVEMIGGYGVAFLLCLIPVIISFKILKTDLKIIKKVFLCVLFVSV